MADEQSTIVDWMSLPPTAAEVSLWAGFHDAQIVTIQPNLLERTITLHLESDHLLEFHNLPLDTQFLLRLDGVQSARVVHHAAWPGPFSIPDRTSQEEQSRLIAEYQSKCRENSLRCADIDTPLPTHSQHLLHLL